jgi:8-hydroxygeraniol dehydrogenase
LHPPSRCRGHACLAACPWRVLGAHKDASEQLRLLQGCSFTYNGKDRQGNVTQGGYSTHIVVRSKCALRVPASLPLEAAAPLLCAGITVYSPLKYYGLDKPGTRLGVMGLGGLGHMAVKFGVAMGCIVTVISR